MQETYTRWVAIALLSAGLTGVASAQMRITEFAYSGEEFVEFTNIGEQSIDMTGWSFDDSSRTPGSLDLSALGSVAAGETVYVAERSAIDFRAAFGLCEAVKVIGNNDQNLGRGDEINLYDAADTLVDRLTYSDQTLGSPRTDVASAYVSAAGLGNNIATEWTLSSVGDAEDSQLSTADFPASPGRSTRASVLFQACDDRGRMRLTEYMYSGANEEFMEFTNVGTAPVDMSGWSYSDSARVIGAVDLSGFGLVQPGESVLLTESDANAFRTAWSLCAGSKLQGDLTVNLGRGDEINLYDAAGRRVDRLTYNDQTLGGPRTQNASAWVSAAGVGANLPTEWTLSALADSEASVASTGGDLGSPGRSTRAQTAFDPCITPPAAPQISVDPAASSPFLLLNPQTGSTISGVIDDPTDPAATEGVAFVLVDEDSAAKDLTVSVSSSNPAVVDVDGLILSGAGLSRQLRIVPSGVGYSSVRVRVSDETAAFADYVLSYAASAASQTPAITRFHTGASDASSAQVLDEDQMLVADDEDQALRVYARDFSGAPLGSFDFTAELALTEGGATPDEVDIESSARIGDRIYWAGSHGNSTAGALRPNRSRVFATDLSNTESGWSLAYVDRYDHLRADLIAWDRSNGHGLGADALGLFDSAAEGIEADAAEGFNIEALAIAPDGSSAWLGFRAPLLPLAARTQALIVPVANFEPLVVDDLPGSRPAGSAVFGAPILLDLGGRAIRSMQHTDDGSYLIIAGPAAASSDLAPDNFRLFIWSGDTDDAAQELPAVLSSTVAGGSFESLLDASAGLGGGGEVEVLLDNGDFVYYNDGVIAKDLPSAAQTKFRSDVIEVRQPGVFGDGFEGN
jgi:hypothetical protein